MKAARLALLLACVLSASAAAQVTFDRLLHTTAEPGNWLTYSGNLESHRHSLLTQVTPANVKNLELQWAFQAVSLEKFDVSNLAVATVIYTVQPPNDVVALDGATSRTYWTYSYKPSPLTRPCCVEVNRGLAILGDTLFMGTIDGRMVALDAKSGRNSGTWLSTARVPKPATTAPSRSRREEHDHRGSAGGEFGIRWIHRRFRPGDWKVALLHDSGKGEPGNNTWGKDSWMRAARRCGSPDRTIPS
jgi:alcohol dehydrogenase (cytochrome c)